MSQFLSAKKLKISKAEHTALIEVMGRLERGEIKHLANPSEETPFRDCFNMGNEIIRSSCGTACCIGGWVALHMGMDDDDDVLDYVQKYMNEQTTLRSLYWDNCDCRTTPQEGADAIRSFLTTGEPNWQRG